MLTENREAFCDSVIEIHGKNRGQQHVCVPAERFCSSGVVSLCASMAPAREREASPCPYPCPEPFLGNCLSGSLPVTPAAVPTPRFYGAGVHMQTKIT